MSDPATALNARLDDDMTAHEEDFAGPQPTPMTINIGKARGSDGIEMVVLQFGSATGMFVAFLDDEKAKAIGNQLTAMTSGLVVAPASALTSPLTR